MAMKFLRGLFGGGGRVAGSKHAAVDYQGFRIQPAPQKTGNGWSTAGTISKEIDGEVKTQRFIRADTSPSEEAAVELSVRKGQRIVDEQGERLFR